MRVSTKMLAILALAVALGLATAVSPYASSSPDGLSKVAADKGFSGDGNLHAIQDDAPIEGYAFPGVHDARLAKGLAGFVGVLFVFAAGYGLAYAVRRRGASGMRASTG